MPLPTTDFSRFLYQPDHSGLSDMFSNYYKGYEQAQTPERLMQERLARELSNEGLQQQNQYNPQLWQEQLKHSIAQRGLYGAQAEKASQPQHGELMKALMDAQQVKQLFPDNTEMQQLADNYVKRKAEGSPGIQLDVDPSTGAISFSQGNRAGGAGKGSQIITDEQGNKQFITPPSSAITNEQQGKQLSNVVRDYLSTAVEQPYLGQGSNDAILADLDAYKQTKDPQAGERLVSAAVSAKLLPEIALQQLQSQGVKATVSAQHHQRNAIMQGWPAALNIVVDNLPPELQKQAKKRHDQILKEAHNLQTQHYAEGTPFELKNKYEKLSDKELDDRIAELQKKDGK